MAYIYESYSNIMQKRLLIIFFLIAIAQFSVSAKKSHRTHAHHRTAHKTHKIHSLQPIVTLNDLDALDSIWGIDVSHHQSIINWETLAEKKPNFMFIKASEGATCQDMKYMENYTEAKKRGILVGSYHFFSYKTTGKEQANNFLSVAQHKNGDLLPVLDAEFIRRMPKKDLVITELSNFIDAVYEKLGNYPIVYCNYNFYKLYLQDRLQNKCKLWIVDYKQKPDCEWTFWQKTNKFKLNGINGFVDLNTFNGSTKAMKDFLLKDHSL